MTKLKSEQRLLKEIEKVGGKYNICHQGTHDGRRQTVAVIKIEDKYFMDSCQCSRKDRFCKAVGRVIALGRAFKNYEKEKLAVPESSIPEVLRFRAKPFA